MYNTNNMKGINNEDRVFYITHKMELLFWLIIILVIVAISSVSFINKLKTQENDYQVYLQDVYGLIVGSPVRILGIPVGHVTEITPINDEVKVKFIITNKDVIIPQGTELTVEFSGMAGSKSLELYPPDKNDVIDESSPLFVVLPAKRLQDALALLNEMYQKLMSIIYTTSTFGEKIQVDNFVDLSKSMDLDEFFEYTNKSIDENNKKAMNLQQQLCRWRAKYDK